MNARQKQPLRFQVREDVLRGRDTNLLRELRRNPWEDLERGLEFCTGLNLAIDRILTQPHGFASGQRKVLEHCLERLQETARRLSPNQILELLKLEERLIRRGEQKGVGVLTSSFLTKYGMRREAVAIMDTIMEAGFLLPPFAPPPETLNLDTIPWLTQLTMLGVVFGDLVESSVEGKSFTWHNFLEAVAEGDTLALQAFEKLGVRHGVLQGSVFLPYSKLSREAWEEIFRRENLYILFNGHIDYPSILPIPDRLMGPVIAQWEKLVAASQARQEKFSAFLAFFEEHREEFRFLEEGMWEDIQLRPNYGLRAHGRDRIRLDLPAFNSGGYSFDQEAIQFFPQAEFHRVAVKFWIRFRGQPVSDTFEIAPGFSSFTTRPAWQHANQRARLVDEIKAFIALHAYWEIVMGRERQTHEASANQEEAARQARQGLRKRVAESVKHTTVRPHFRNLPPGTRASAEALANAAHVFVVDSLPLGKTFVREHERGWQEMEEIPPVFTYKEDDLLSWWK